MSVDARISVTLPSHPKTRKLIKRHGAGAGWSLICLFLWAAANRSDGNLAGMTNEDIELASDWSGDDGVFVQAIVSVGFLDGRSGDYLIHDWAQHNPWAAGRMDRSEAAKWAALCRRYGQSGAAGRMPDYANRLRNPSATPAVGSDPHAPGSDPLCGLSAPIPLPSPLPKTESVTTTENITITESLEREAREKKKNTPKRVGQKMPLDWQADDRYWGLARKKKPHWNDDQITNELENFKEHFTNGNGRETARPDFFGSWRTWLNRSDNFALGRSNGEQRPKGYGNSAVGFTAGLILGGFTGENLHDIPQEPRSGHRVPRIRIDSPRPKPGAIRGFGDSPQNSDGSGTSGNCEDVNAGETQDD